MGNEPARILILGGTMEARLLAARLEGDARFSPLTSLAGVTRKRAAIAGELRSGGFGGAQGLRDFLQAEGIALMVDATHAYAAQISAHAARAGELAGVPCLRLERKSWQKQPRDNWGEAADMEAAARALLPGANVLLTIGRKGVAPFFARRDIRVLARMIEPPGIAVPENVDIILARPPFTLAQELALMREHGISVLVAKNSGGKATYAKIEAARELRLPVVLIARPHKPPLDGGNSVVALMQLIEGRLHPISSGQ